LDRDCDFSHFPGVLRQFLVAQGQVTLNIAGLEIVCSELSVTPFSGDSATTCNLSASAKALNLMQHTPRRRLVVIKAGDLFPEENVDAVVAVGGTASLVVGGECLELELLDAVMWTKAEQPVFQLTSGSVALVVR